MVSELTLANRNEGGPGQQKRSGQPVRFIFLILAKIARHKGPIFKNACFREFVAEQDMRKFMHNHVVASAM